jgi:hypothetical protein
VTIALVAEAAQGGFSFGGSTTSGVDTTGANLLVLCVGFGTGGSVSTPADTYGNTWNLVEANGDGNHNNIQIWYAKNPVVGSGHQTWASAPSANTLIFSAWSGCDTVSPFDQGGSLANIGTGWGYGVTITPTQNNELIVAVGGNSNYGPTPQHLTYLGSSPGGGNSVDGTAAASYTIQTTAASVFEEFQVYSTANAPTGIASFKAAAVAAGGWASRPIFPLPVLNF